VFPSGIYSCREKDLWKIKLETRTDGVICAVSTPGGNIYIYRGHNLSEAMNIYQGGNLSGGIVHDLT
jgi:hypothetical protein